MELVGRAVTPSTARAASARSSSRRSTGSRLLRSIRSAETRSASSLPDTGRRNGGLTAEEARVKMAERIYRVSSEWAVRDRTFRRKFFCTAPPEPVALAVSPRSPVQGMRELRRPGRRLDAPIESHESVCRALRSQPPTPRQEWDSVREAFRSVDTDHSGSISYEEFASLLLRWDIALDDAEFRRLIHHYDPNEDGTITYAEWIKTFGETISGGEQGGVGAMLQQHEGREMAERQRRAAAARMRRQPKITLAQVREGLRAKMADQWTAVRTAFRSIDTDKSGTLEASEFRALLVRWGFELDDETFGQLVKE